MTYSLAVLGDKVKMPLIGLPQSTESECIWYKVRSSSLSQPRSCRRVGVLSKHVKVLHGTPKSLPPASIWSQSSWILGLEALSTVVAAHLNSGAQLTSEIVNSLWHPRAGVRFGS